MKKKKYIIGLISVFVVLMIFNIIVFANGVPGSEEDPLVTLGYLETKIQELKDYIDVKIQNSSDSSEEVNTVTGDENLNNNITGNEITQTYQKFEVLNLSEGQKLLCDESTELILRGGKAEAIDNGVDGISDITKGKDLKTGDNVDLNHLILVPRNDGRGILAKSQVWVMVKGKYTIQ